jgi:hypothetical protein
MCHKWIVIAAVSIAAAPTLRGGESLEQKRVQAHLNASANPATAGRQTAADYYVSSTGSDSNPGTAAAPFSTIQRAANLVRPGDTVHVRAGAYSGFNLNSPGGSEARPVIFEAEPDVIIRTAAKNGPNPDSGINVEHSGGTAWIEITGFHIDGQDGTMERAGIRLTGCSHVQVRDCTIENSAGNWGIFVSLGSDLLIEHNICRNSGGQHGIYACRGSSRVTIRGNVLSGNHWDGLHLNGGADGPIDRCLIENNVIFGNHLSGMDCDGVQNSVFRNNVIYGNDKHAVTLYNHDTPTGCVHNLLVNNTFVSGSMFAIQMQPGSTANSLYNNILYHFNPAVYGSIGVKGVPAQLLSDYNLTADSFSTDLGVTRQTLAQWRARTGQEVHSGIAGPADRLFANPTASDYHLKTGSPAIGSGTRLSEPCQLPFKDIDGNNRTDGKRWDIGAYSFGAPGDAGAARR